MSVSYTHLDVYKRQILKMDGQEQIRIIIVDNDIHEDPQKRKGLAERYEKFPCITVLPIFENGGFSYANNQGYAYAVSYTHLQIIQQHFPTCQDMFFISSHTKRRCTDSVSYTHLLLPTAISVRTKPEN